MTLLATIPFLCVSRYAAAFAPPADPCSVLTTEQVSAALDAKSTAGKHVVATLCEWDAVGQQAAARSRKLTLGFLSASAWEQTKALRERMHSFKRTPVEGLGEEAVFSTNGTICTLQVKKGSAVLDMHLFGFAADQAKAKEIALARVALGKF